MTAGGYIRGGKKMGGDLSGRGFFREGVCLYT